MTEAEPKKHSKYYSAWKTEMEKADRWGKSSGAVERYRNQKYPALYCSMYPLLITVANNNGYALAIYGSLMHDMDLIAVPWTDDATDQRTLVDEIISCI